MHGVEKIALFDRNRHYIRKRYDIGLWLYGSLIGSHTVTALTGSRSIRFGSDDIQ